MVHNIFDQTDGMLSIFEYKINSTPTVPIQQNVWEVREEHISLND